MMCQLAPPPRPVMADVITPNVQLVRNSLATQQLCEPPGRRQRARGMCLLLPLTAHEQDREALAQPVNVVFIETGHVVGGIGEVRPCLLYTSDAADE